jgi:glycosyltransferase involved in cell wall biosynthesis
MGSMEYTSDISLSIIIPVFNCEPYLLIGFEKLKPIYLSDINFEIIYVNDGSTDNSLKVLREIEGDNSFVTVIDQENQGSSGARNTAIELAKGQYIQFLDADDFIEIVKFLAILKNAINNNIDAISYRLRYVNEHYTELGIMNANRVPYNKIISGKEALIAGYYPSSICVFLFKTAFLHQHKLRITPKITHMDVEFTSRMMLVADKVMFVEDVVYNYLQREGSITKPKSKEKLQQFLYDEVIISNTIRNTIESSFKQELTKAIQKNYNSVIWNLLWRLSTKTNEVDFDFKLKCIADLKALGLYPIKGALKSNFQRFICLFFNQEWLLKFFFKIERLIEKKVPTNHILNLTSEKEHKKSFNLSIIIPVYNSEEFLQRCFESVCNLSNLLPL